MCGLWSHMGTTDYRHQTNGEAIVLLRKTGRVTLVLLALAGLTLLGCKAVADQSAELQANAWIATDIRTANGLEPVLKDLPSTAKFLPDGQLGGNGGINQYSAKYTTDGRTMNIGPVAATQMAGGQLPMAQEELFFDALRKTVRYRVYQGSLELFDSADNIVAKFRPYTGTPFLSTKWECIGYNNGKGAVQSVSASSSLTALFDPEGSVAGDSGVNTFSGPYKLDGQSLAIGPLVTTRKAGPPELMEQEAAYLEALSKSARYQIIGDKMDFYDSQGARMADFRATGAK
ncbi:MAG: META domain-containing protein [Actinobacteria bacterium]|nr:MAG: META domain-containing protein [Actinomycetota bacterium]